MARLHSGDLSIWSALAEQMRRLDGLGIPYTVTPGVPAFAAAAALLRRELTVPGRGTIGGADAHLRPRERHAANARPSRLSRPPGRRWRSISRSTWSRRVAAELIPFYGPACPAAAVFRASWPDERVLTGDSRRCPGWSAEAGLERTALILVGPALAAEAFRESALYAADYDRRFRPGGTVGGAA